MRVEYETTSSGSRVGNGSAASALSSSPSGLRGPPNPPAPRMKSAVRVEKAGSPLPAWRDSLSSTTRPAAPLSYMPATVVVVDTVPAAGSSPCSRMDCSPWTSIAGS